MNNLGRFATSKNSKEDTQKSIGPLAAEQQFFSSLIGGDVGALDRILGDDFLPIDVMRGPEVEQPDLLPVLGSGQLKFEAIQPVESQVRLYRITAVITGRTQISGRFGETPFTASSLCTHVFADAELRDPKVSGSQSS